MTISDNDVVDVTPPVEDNLDRAFPGFGRWLYENFNRLRVCLGSGVSGTFTTADAKTVTVTKGIITDIT